MTQEYVVELFDAGGVNPRLRWHGPGGSPPVQRQLNPSEIQQLLGMGRAYEADRPDLVSIGSRLYQWLDGPTERWLQAAQATQESLTIRLAGEEKLRGLPWETLHADGGFVCVHPYRPIMVVRTASARAANTAWEMANRPLRVVFMASSPSDVEPVLDFEAEEAQILAASADLVDLVVEESGSLDGLVRVLEQEEHPFDVIHLSGHGAAAEGGSRLLMEDDLGRCTWISAADLAKKINRWPRLLFLSACHTGDSVGDQVLASMAEELVAAGAPAVLGWSLPVSDWGATQLAVTLYQRLGSGASVLDAVTQARCELFDKKHAAWHQLRLYADRRPLGELVTRPRTAHRTVVTPHRAQDMFLDVEGRVRVASRASFVGRRRDLQRILRMLSDTLSDEQGVVIHGMGGLGKSSLTARVLDRLKPSHPYQAVWTGRIDENEIRRLPELLNLDEAAHDQVTRLINKVSSPLTDRIRFILQGPLADASHHAVFVFDDFENGNLDDDGHGGHLVTAPAGDVLGAFASAIARTGSHCRIIVTSRHNFTPPTGVRLVPWSISKLTGADLTKKLAAMSHLRPSSPVATDLRTRAIEAAEGIPRLIEAVNEVLATGDATEELLDRIAATKREYREKLMLEVLLQRQPVSVQRLLAVASVYEIAVPKEAIEAVVPCQDVASDLATAVDSGLLQAGLHPMTNETRYLVPRLLLDLLETVDDEDLRAMQKLAAHALYRLWVADGE